MALSSLGSINVPFPMPVQVSSPRIQLAYVNMNADALDPARGASVEEIQHHLVKRQQSASIADTLWAAPENQHLVSQFLNNNLTTTCAHSTDHECLPLYQKYSVQDYFYLEDYVKYKAHRLISIPTGEISALSNEANSVSSDAKYAISAGHFYVQDLHGRPEDLADGNRSIAELAYGNVLQNAASYEDWYNLHILSIPSKIAGTDTIFYQTWIKPNSDPSSSRKLTAFLSANEAVWKDGIDTGTSGRMGEWTSLFRTALRLEIAMFASAFEE
ncbi:MAG: hypothetical protein Q9194_007229 [Teloschistes cf. exilis]